MKTLNCDIVTVQLKPSVIREDLAVIGVIVRCDETGYSGFRLIDAEGERVKELDLFFRGYGIDNIRQAVAWAEGDIRFAIEREKCPDGKGAFANLIRPRENVVRYGKVRSAIATDPEKLLAEEYGKLVE